MDVGKLAYLNGVARLFMKKLSVDCLNDQEKYELVIEHLLKVWNMAHSEGFNEGLFLGFQYVKDNDEV